MIRHHLKPEQLHQDGQFELIRTVDYKQMKSFVIDIVRNRNRLLIIYSIFQLLSLSVWVGWFVLCLIDWQKKTIFCLLISFVFSLTVLIPLHESAHALAFLILGKKNIGFGAQLKKFVFYAEAHRQVIDRREITIVALMPLVLLGFAGLTLAIIGAATLLGTISAGVILIHPLFCAGDIALISYFNQYRPQELFSYDDRIQKKTFYFKKKEAVPGRDDLQVLT